MSKLPSARSHNCSYNGESLLTTDIVLGDLEQLFKRMVQQIAVTLQAE
jgi:hypothetical protein